MRVMRPVLQVSAMALVRAVGQVWVKLLTLTGGGCLVALLACRESAILTH